MYCTSCPCAQTMLLFKTQATQSAQTVLALQLHILQLVRVARLGREARQRPLSAIAVVRAAAMASAMPYFREEAVASVVNKRVEVSRGAPVWVQAGRRCVVSGHRTATRSSPSLWTAASVQQTRDNQSASGNDSAPGSSFQHSGGRAELERWNLHKHFRSLSRENPGSHPREVEAANGVSVPHMGRSHGVVHSFKMDPSRRRARTVWAD